jgi:pimeloyl-ACP methyl ester carboxylesterase
LVVIALALLIICCNQPKPIDFETIVKDDGFRASVKTGAFIKLSNGYTYYEHINPTADTLVVLVHGFSVPSYIWDSTFYHLQAQGYGVLRYDTYGRGFSENPDVVYDVALFSNQLKELLEALAIAKSITLVGLSDGGRTISAFAFQFPERVKNLVYVDAVGFTPVTDTASHPASVTSEEIKAFKQSERYATMASGQMTDFYDSIPFRGWDKRYANLMQHHGFVRAILSTNKNRTDLGMEMQRIAGSGMPVYAIWGEHDTVVKLDEVRPSMMARMPNIKLFVIPKAGHLPHMEQANRFNTILVADVLRKNN